jgi:hypothetical protein
MDRIVIIAVATTVAVGCVLAGGPIVVVPVVATAVAWVAWGRPAQPMAPLPAARRWRWWLAAGVVSFAVGVAIPQIDGGELSGGWWTVMVAALLVGVASAAVAVTLAVRPTAPRPT